MVGRHGEQRGCHYSGPHRRRSADRVAHGCNEATAPSRGHRVRGHNLIQGPVTYSALQSNFSKGAGERNTLRTFLHQWGAVPIFWRLTRGLRRERETPRKHLNGLCDRGPIGRGSFAPNQRILTRLHPSFVERQPDIFATTLGGHGDIRECRRVAVRA
jgi:hypothetical protein